MTQEDPKDELFKCDNCHQYGFPEEFAYIGPKDRTSDECGPFVEWEQVCAQCEH